MKPNKKMIDVAEARLGDDGRAELAWSKVPGMPDACFFAVSVRGSGRLLVNAAGESLWAASSVTPRAHVEAFRAGRRS